MLQYAYTYISFCCVKYHFALHVDINECAGFLNGGCEDLCLNTIGSYKCFCSGNTTLTSDGFTCTGNVTCIRSCV